MSKKYFGIIETVNKVTGHENKKCSAWKWILAIVGILAAIAGVAYALYRLTQQDCLEDFEEDFEDDFDDEYFEDEEDAVVVEEPVEAVPTVEAQAEAQVEE
ncbi:MAG: hypothetical protein E7299_00835 [Lachnospiraceae bacterium]|nr:hypothetical protein [Lachnospiraceae bacterium]